MSRLMKVCVVAAMLAVVAVGQRAPASPAETATVTVDGKAITVKYSAPSVRGRQIFGPGGLLSHDPTYPVWRAGANAATSFHTDGDLMLGSLQVPKGDYTLYALVSDPDHWQLVVNKQTGQWGLTYDPKQDLGRVPMDMSVPPQTIERLQYILTPDKLTLEWEKHIASVAMRVE